MAATPKARIAPMGRSYINAPQDCRTISFG